VREGSVHLTISLTLTAQEQTQIIIRSHTNLPSINIANIILIQDSLRNI
jgi:hypothetical protein